jgi:hypothetical protein
MSKIINSLLPEDFGKSFDEKVFESWKRSLNDLEQAQIIVYVLYGVGFVALLTLGIVGLMIFFLMMIVSLVIVLPKRSKSKSYRLKLGVSNRDFQNAIIAAKKRTKL